jgi:hypothetical protein
MANNIMPGEHDWMSRVPGMNPGMGMGMPAPQQPGLLQRAMGGLGGLLGGTSGYGGMLDEDQKKALQHQALLSLGANLMAQSGPSPTRVSFGQALGNSMLATQQQAGQQGNGMLEAMLLKTKLQKAKEGDKPSDVQSYEYAKTNGYKGTFEDWKRVAAAQQQETSDIQNWKFVQGLTPEQQKQWMSMQRQPTAPQLAVINGVPTLVDRIQKTTTPLTSLQSEIGATSAKAEAEAIAKATGSAAGEAQGAQIKRGFAAKNVNDILDVADPLVDLSTGSKVGATTDKVAAFFGKSLSGAEAASQLRILQGALMFAQPRMEGPQGVLDVQLYEEMAGKIGDPTIPADQKKAAMRTIRDLYAKYSNAAGSNTAAPGKRPPLSTFQK